MDGIDLIHFLFIFPMKICKSNQEILWSVTKICPILVQKTSIRIYLPASVESFWLIINRFCSHTCCCWQLFSLLLILHYQANYLNKWFVSISCWVHISSICERKMFHQNMSSPIYLKISITTNFCYFSFWNIVIS